MDKNKSAVQQFLEDVPSDQNNIFNETLADPFEQPIAQEQVVEEKVVDEKPLPFHKDPKVQKFIEKEIDRRMNNKVESKPQVETQTNDEFKDVIDSFTVIVGNDTPEKVTALKGLERALGNLDQRAARKATERLEEIRNKELEEEKAAEEELNNAFSTIEETYDYDFSTPQGQKTRSKFMSFVEKIAPKRNGEIIDYPDMNSAWETFNEVERATAQPNRAKELASRGINRSSGTAAVQPKRMDWNAVDEMMDSLK